MFGERLKIARKGAGLSVTELGKVTDLSAYMLKKYENASKPPQNVDIIAQLAKACGVSIDFFFMQTKAKLTNEQFRKRSGLTQKELAKIMADIRNQAERWVDLEEILPRMKKRPAINDVYQNEKIDDLEQLEDVATCTRKQWNLGTDPIKSLVHELEEEGFYVILTNVDENIKFDGVLAYCNDDKPLIAIAKHWPGDRQRFTLAHELGHFLLEGKKLIGLNEEKACNRFAGALLMPKDAVFTALGNKRNSLEANELYNLKQAYGISMHACVFRAFDLKIINKETQQKLFMWFKMQGWHINEPGEPYPQEKNCLFTQFVYRALGEQLITLSKAAYLLQKSLTEIMYEQYQSV